LTECGNLLQAEAEEMEAVAVAVKMAAVVVTDEKGDGRRHIGGNSGA
jgi:hypothetical protein